MVDRLVGQMYVGTTTCCLNCIIIYFEELHENTHHLVSIYLEIVFPVSATYDTNINFVNYVLALSP